MSCTLGGLPCVLFISLEHLHDPLCTLEVLRRYLQQRALPERFQPGQVPKGFGTPGVKGIRYTGSLSGERIPMQTWACSPSVVEEGTPSNGNEPT
eukprot:s5126_g3.t1